MISYCHCKMSLMISIELLSTYLMSTTILSTDLLPRNSCPSIFLHIETHLLPVSNPRFSHSPISHPPNAHPQDYKTSTYTSKLIFYQSPICCEKPLGKTVIFSVLCKIIKKKTATFVFKILCLFQLENSTKPTFTQLRVRLDNSIRESVL